MVPGPHVGLKGPICLNDNIMHVGKGNRRACKRHVMITQHVVVGGGGGGGEQCLQTSCPGLPCWVYTGAFLPVRSEIHVV